MEDYNLQLSENTNSRGGGGGGGGFLYGGGPVLAPSSSVYGGGASGGSSNHHSQLSGFHLQGGDCNYDHPTVKTEAGTSQNHHHHHQAPWFHNPSVIRPHQGVNRDHHHHVHQRRPESDAGGGGGDVDAIKAKIIAHPQYSNLLEAYMDCQKVN